MSFVYGTSIGLIRDDLIELLGREQVERDLFLGSVTNEKGAAKRWRTFRARRPIQVRGDAQSTARRCPECGALLYWASALTEASRYICPAPPDSGLYFENSMGLVLPQDRLEQIERMNWPDIDIETLEVLAAPRDGFPLNLEDVR